MDWDREYRMTLWDLVVYVVLIVSDKEEVPLNVLPFSEQVKN